MINKIAIKNFKSLEDVSLNMGKLNVFTGINGMGKSTVIQSLLLIRQFYVYRNTYGRGIPLNGFLTGDLGEFNDVLYKNAKEDRITFELGVDTKSFIWKLVKGDASDLLKGDFPTTPWNVLTSKDEFQYLGADRISPDTIFSKSGEALLDRQFGNRGEYVVQYLYEVGSQWPALFSEINDSHYGTPLPLINQVDYWLREITPNVSLDIQIKNSREYDLRYKVASSTAGPVSLSARNAPFGLTYSLPVVTSILSARPGDLLIIENPENDLHPRAQSMIGRMLAKAANAGAQIIIETHSDHVLNGICVEISKGQIESSATRFFYFYKPAQALNSISAEIKISPSGRMDDSDLRSIGVSGFFDQTQLDLKTILFGNKSNENLS